MWAKKPGVKELYDRKFVLCFLQSQLSLCLRPFVCLLTGFESLAVTVYWSTMNTVFQRRIFQRTWSSFVSPVWSLPDRRHDSPIIWWFCSFVKIDDWFGDAGIRAFVNVSRSVLQVPVSQMFWLLACFKVDSILIVRVLVPGCCSAFFVICYASLGLNHSSGFLGEFTGEDVPLAVLWYWRY